MGICKSMPRYRVVLARSLFTNEKKYSRSVPCRIKKRNSKHKIIDFKETQLMLPDPIEISSYKALFSEKTF